MNRSVMIAITAIGFLSAAVSLIQSFSFNQLQALKFEYSCSPGGENAVFPFLKGAHAHVGDVVWLDAQVCAGGSGHPPFEREAVQNSVSWQFDPCTTAEQVGRQCAFTADDPNRETSWGQTKVMLALRLSDSNVSYDDVEEYLTDNGTSVTIRGVGQDANPFTNFEINTEGNDEAHGPFQISMSNRDGNRRLWLSPAPYTEALAKQVRCFKRRWPGLAKFLVCPLA